MVLLGAQPLPHCEANTKELLKRFFFSFYDYLLIIIIIIIITTYYYYIIAIFMAFVHDNYIYDMRQRNLNI